MLRNKERYDLIIIGAGPAGLSAAIYMARAKYRVLVIEKDNIGGQILITDNIVNYPGIVNISGEELVSIMKYQAKSFGAEFVNGEVTEVELGSSDCEINMCKDGRCSIQNVIKKVTTNNRIYETYAIILAMGANPRKIGFEGELEYIGRGVAYCATCDGEFFNNKTIFVIGGGYAACEEGIFLTRYARQVIMIVRGNDFSCAKSISDEVKKHSKIKVHYNTEIVKVGGDNRVEYAVFYNNKDGGKWEFREEDGSNFGVFVFAGYVPNTQLVKNYVKLNDFGYIQTDIYCNTNIKGVAAAGDICIKELRQVVTAISDGAIAATTMEKYVATLYEKYGFKNNILKDNMGKVISIHDDEQKDRIRQFVEKFHNKIMVKVFTNKVSGENVDENTIKIRALLTDIKVLSNKIEVEYKEDEISPSGRYPYIAICDSKGQYVGTGYHGIPSGHEFNSFLTALFNLAGPGMNVDEGIITRIHSLDKMSIKLLVTPSCSMCPELVKSAQYLAIMSDNITTEVYDILLYPDLCKKYNVMSVPCMIINDKDIYFGKKSLDELLKILGV